MAIHIRRREFIVALGGAATWPLAARAQGPSAVVGMPRIGKARRLTKWFLHIASAADVRSWGKLTEWSAPLGPDRSSDLTG